MQTLDRYVARLVWKPALLALVITTIVFSVFNFAAYLREVVVGELLVEQFLWRVVLRDAVAAEILLPTTFFFGMVFALCNWHKDREAHALYAAGVSPWRVERILYGMSIVVALLALLLSTSIRPWAYKTLAQLDQKAAQDTASTILPGQFHESGGVVLNAKNKSAKTGELQDVFVFRKLDTQSEVLRSDSALIGKQREDGSRPVEFILGENYRFDETHRMRRRIEFERLIYLKEFEVRRRSPRRQAMSNAELKGLDHPKAIAEYQWRFTMPAVALMLGFFGIAFGRLNPGASPYARFGLGLLFYIGIFNLASGIRSALENQQIGPFPGLYWLPIGMAVVFVLLLIRGNRVDLPK